MKMNMSNPKESGRPPPAESPTVNDRSPTAKIGFPVVGIVPRQRKSRFRSSEWTLATDIETLGLTAQVATLKTENDTTEQYLALRQEERAQQDPKAMTKAREATDEAYVLTVQVINAFTITDEQHGVSPYDTCIDNINSDQEYYIQHVFTKDKKLKTLKITDEAVFSYVQGETWATAIEEHPQENAGWSVSNDDLDHVLFGEQLLKKDDEAVDATSKVVATGTYTLEGDEGGGDEGGGGEVTPVTPE